MRNAKITQNMEDDLDELLGLINTQSQPKKNHKNYKNSGAQNMAYNQIQRPTKRVLNSNNEYLAGMDLEVPVKEEDDDYSSRYRKNGQPANHIQARTVPEVPAQYEQGRNAGAMSYLTGGGNNSTFNQSMTGNMNLINEKHENPIINDIELKLKNKFKNSVDSSMSSEGGNLEYIKNYLKDKDLVQTVDSVTLMVIHFEIRDRLMYLTLTDLTEVVEMAAFPDVYEPVMDLVKNTQALRGHEFFYHKIKNQVVYNYQAFNNISLQIGNILNLGKVDFNMLNGNLFGVLDKDNLIRVMQ